jgi:hypothetical protein
MNTQTYFWCSLLGLLGIAFQTLIKIDTFQKQSRLANKAFSPIDYFKNDWITVSLNILTLIVALIIVDEITTFKPDVIPFIKWFFFFIGYTGSSLLNRILSKTQSGIDKVIDVKTDIADGVQK